LCSVLSVLTYLVPSCRILVFCSFPTRRSSDLGSRTVPCREVWLPALFRPVPRSGGEVRRARSATGRRLPRRPAPDAGGGVDVRSDRKSTRLNSSHVSISYAVFCLKKTNQLNWL